MDDKPLILIADDERDIVSMLKSYFELNGYLVATAFDGTQVLERVAKHVFDVILLDVNMPSLDGIEACRKIRDTVSCPIIFLTARVEDMDTIDGFAAGGDDYVTKPFSLDVLGARVAAHRARDRRKRTQSTVRIDERLSIDFARRAVLSCGVEVSLTKKEYEICALLIRHANQTFDRDRIYELVWGEPGDGSVVTEHIRRLRKALAEAGAEVDYIKTVWGVGYRWEA
ncbi:response regulator transcription factor [Raoultibacter phocaeensis]|uniref:response regulator transcription factor n=1 Tax=Raoultibacter phocaeensis TaxID=2479841 RepID=UPI00111B46DF|nr:response regulator transcription factor [Raoultibacter phocaeensis]